MKASRAYIAGLGTSGVLIASFLLLLVVGSAIVAFQGAPGQASNDGLARLDVSQASKQTVEPSRTAEGGGRTGARASRRDDRGRAGKTPAAGRIRIGSGMARGAGGVEGRRATSGLTGGPAGAGAPEGSSAGSSQGRDSGGGGGATRRLPSVPMPLPDLPPAPGQGGVSGVTGGLSQTVENTTDGLGQTVGRVAPPLQAPVERTGETVAGVVEQTGPALDGTVGQVNTTFDNATGSVGGVTAGVSGTAGGLLGGAP